MRSWVTQVALPNMAIVGGSDLSHTVIVPDRRSRIIPEVILVRRWAVGVLGLWRGEGLGEGWDKGGQLTSNLRPRWTSPVTARRVPSK